VPVLKRARARILYYVPSFEVGGTEKNVHDLALGLPRDRFDPVVIWSCYWGPLGDNLRNAGVPVHHFPLNRATGLAEAVSGIREIQPDIFHSFSYRKDDRDVRAAGEAGVPTILTSRGDLRFWDRLQTVQEWENFRNQRTHRITVCSKAIASRVQEVEGVPSSKIRVIHNGVSLPVQDSAATTLREDLGIAADAPLIGYVGNYRNEKGHETLLQAFRRVLDVQPSARLVCCGGSHPGVKQRVEATASELGLDGRAFLLDLQLDVARVYRAINLYVHPSDTEGFSNALLEGMSHGLAIIATRAGGNPEAIQDGETGLLVSPGDSVGLAAAILSLLNNPVFGATLGRAAQDRVQRQFQFHHMLSGYTRLYEEELGRQ
jgi:glycosyltransferase involved in cell wall biosynthesis